MAGYMKKQNGHVYDGSHLAGEELANGVFVEIAADGVKKVTAAGDMQLRIVEKTTLWKKPALVLDVIAEGVKEVYLTENEWDVYDNMDYDTADYTVKTGKLVKMHRPLVGEQLIVSVEKDLFETLNEADIVTPAAGGTVAKKS